MFIHNVFSYLRKEYSTEFSALFGDSFARETYRDGLVFLSCIIGSVFFIWTVVILTLKFNGQFVGCASGAKFRPEYSDDPEEIPYGDTESQNTDTSSDHDLQLVLEDASQHSSLPSEFADLSFNSIAEESAGKGSVASSVIHLPSTRERRTQVVFLFFASLTLLCVPLAHALFFLPLREASNQTPDYIVEARDIIKEVQASANSLSTGLANSFSILKALPQSESEVCPRGDPDAIEKMLGFELSAMIKVYRSDYLGVEANATKNTREVYRFMEHLDKAFAITESATEKAEVYLWLVPGILLSTICVVLAVSVGTIISWRRESSERMQLFLSYLVLPLLMVISLTCWALAIASAMGTAVATDACMAGSSAGSPALTVQKILTAEGVEATSFLAEMFWTYSNSCSGPDPTEIILSHGEQATAITETIWQYIIAVDSIGRNELDAMCGAGNEVNKFLQSLRDLAQQLTTVSRAFDSLSLSLLCPRINGLYDQAVNQSLCTQSADSFAYGFIIFLAMGMTTMILISLRASWGQFIAEDKIYEEHEVAENMIVDEHEEYLLYISKYKHEWEEYDGLNTHPQNPISPLFGSMDSQSSPRTQSESVQSSGNSPGVLKEHATFFSPHCIRDPEVFDPYDSESRSVSSLNSGEISFPSLTESPMQERSKQSSLLESRNPDSEKACNDDDGRINHAFLSDEKGIVSSTGDSIELRLPRARYPSRQRARPQPERDVYIEPTHGSVKFVLQVEDASPSLVQERVDQLSKPQRNRPLTPPRVRNQKMKELASFFDSPANADVHGP